MHILTKHGSHIQSYVFFYTIFYTKDDPETKIIWIVLQWLTKFHDKFTQFYVYMVE
jgi:hypothetical protein